LTKELEKMDLGMTFRFFKYFRCQFSIKGEICTKRKKTRRERGSGKE
jgi:hypothetical protein